MRRRDEPTRARPAPTRVAGVFSAVLALAWLVLATHAVAAPKRSAPSEPSAPPATKSAPATTTPAPSEPDAPEPESPEPDDPGPDAPDPTAPDPDAPEAPADAPTEPTDAPAAPTGVDPAALERLDAESRALQDDLFKARARVAVVTSKLFRAKITLQLRSNLERFYEVSDLQIALDGAPVFLQEKGWPTAAGDLFEVYAAPGAHELTISARLVARRDATYKLRIDDTFTVFVPEDSTVSTRLLLRETGNMWRFTKRGRGRHVLTAILRARARPNERRGAKAKAKTSVSAGGQG